MSRALPLLFLCVLGTLAGCDGNNPDGNARDRCAEIDFARRIWTPTVSNTCYGCHLRGGYSQEVGSRFVLAGRNEPDYLSTNLAAVQQQGTHLLDKVSGRLPHDGGVVLPSDSDGYRALADFLRTPPNVPACGSATVPNDLPLEPGRTTLRRAALQVAGRLPSAEELELVDNGQLDAAIQRILSDPALGTFVKRVYQDIFFTDRFNGDNLVGFIYDRFYTGSWYVGGRDPLAKQVELAWGLAHNADELMAYIATQDRPYSEALTADYNLVNALGACELLGPGHNITFPDSCTAGATPMNACSEAAFAWNAYDECHSFAVARPNPGRFPVIGVLSDPALFTVYGSTPSNKNRHRAAMVLKTFLGLDVLELGSSVAAGVKLPPAETKPTLTNPQCQVCHRIVDGVASSFQNWSDLMGQGGIAGVYRQGSGVYDDQFAPHLGNVAMQPGDGGGEPLRWLGSSIAADERFASAAVRLWYSALTGQKVLAEPSLDDPAYADKLRAKLQQNALFAAQARVFTAAGLRLKPLITALILSPAYRSAAVPEARATELQAFDHTHRRGPEALDDLVTATLGTPWQNPSGPATPSRPSEFTASRHLRSDFRVTYGGIDSLNTLMRNADMSPVAAAVANAMAQEMPCGIVAQEFSRAADQRKLLAGVEMNDSPTNEAGRQKIRAAIASLHERLLGQTVLQNDAEVDAALALFTAVAKNHASDGALPQGCATPTVGADVAGVLHGWMAVLTYMMQDFAYLYD